MPATSSSTFEFKRGRHKINWAVVAGLDIQAIQKKTELNTLQEVLRQVAFADLSEEDTATLPKSTVFKFVCAVQVLLQYLLHTQDYLSKCNVRRTAATVSLTAEKEKINTQLRAANDEVHVLRAENSKLSKELNASRTASSHQVQSAAAPPHSAHSHPVHTAPSVVLIPTPPSQPQPYPYSVPFDHTSAHLHRIQQHLDMLTAAVTKNMSSTAPLATDDSRRGSFIQSENPWREDVTSTVSNVQADHLAHRSASAPSSARRNDSQQLAIQNELIRTLSMLVKQDKGSKKKKKKRKEEDLNSFQNRKPANDSLTSSETESQLSSPRSAFIKSSKQRLDGSLKPATIQRRNLDDLVVQDLEALDGQGLSQRARRPQSIALEDIDAFNTSITQVKSPDTTALLAASYPRYSPETNDSINQGAERSAPVPRGREIIPPSPTTPDRGFPKSLANPRSTPDKPPTPVPPPQPQPERLTMEEVERFKREIEEERAAMAYASLRPPASLAAKLASKPEAEVVAAVTMPPAVTPRPRSLSPRSSTPIAVTPEMPVRIAPVISPSSAPLAFNAAARVPLSEAPWQKQSEAITIVEDLPPPAEVKKESKRVVPQPKVACRYCGEDILSSMLATHEEQCDRREVVCDYCGREVELCEVDNHQAQCPYRPVGCPHCHQQISKNVMNIHLLRCPAKVKLEPPKRLAEEDKRLRDSVSSMSSTSDSSPVFARRKSNNRSSSSKAPSPAPSQPPKASLETVVILKDSNPPSPVVKTQQVPMTDDERELMELEAKMLKYGMSID